VSLDWISLERICVSSSASSPVKAAILVKRSLPAAAARSTSASSASLASRARRARSSGLFFLTAPRAPVRCTSRAASIRRWTALKVSPPAAASTSSPMRSTSASSSPRGFCFPVSGSRSGSADNRLRFWRTQIRPSRPGSSDLRPVSSSTFSSASAAWAMMRPLPRSVRTADAPRPNCLRSRQRRP